MKVNIVPPGKTCSRPGCNEYARRLWGVSFYCWKHYRFVNMKNSAQRRGKTVPTYDDLEKLSSNGLACVCGCEMIWHSALGDRKDVVSLQHDDDGTVRFLCTGCNAAHGQMGDDRFYRTPEGMGFCGGCGEFKPKDCFSKNRTRRQGRQSRCRDCHNKANREYRARVGRRDRKPKAES